MSSEAIQSLLRYALECHQTGRLKEAAAIYQEVLRQEPNNPHVIHLLGLVAHQLGDHGKAVELITQAIQLKSNEADFHNNLGEALRAMGQIDQAIACYQRAVMLRPDYLQAYINLGNALQSQGRYDEAIAVYDRVLAANYYIPAAHNNRGYALLQKGELEEAVTAFKTAIGLDPRYFSAYLNLGIALRTQGQIDEAIDAYRKAIQLRPDLPDPHVNLGYALQQKGQFEEALAAFNQAIQINPDYAESHLNKALLLLLRGEYAEGWAEYEWRWHSREMRLRQRDFTQPRWDGTDLSGRTILLHAEQGFGDTIQFIRYVPMVANLGAKVIVECQPELKNLLQSVEGAQVVLGAGESLPPFDLHCPLLSLPLCFGTILETIPATVPYLHVQPELVEQWRRKVTSASTCVASCRNVGLVWAGNPMRKDDRERSLPLSVLTPLAGMKNVCFFSLQKGPSAQDSESKDALKLIDLTEQLRDFADTAALILNLDLVITVDTAVAHLAGALAKPVWVLLEYVPAWRWLLDREDSPWYPTMRLFRQKRCGDWDGVIQKVVEELKAGA